MFYKTTTVCDYKTKTNINTVYNQRYKLTAHTETENKPAGGTTTGDAEEITQKLKYVK